MDEEDSTFTDGTFQSERFFSCAPNRALFIPLSRCKLDSRFQDQDVVDNAKAIDTEVRKSAVALGKDMATPNDVSHIGFRCIKILGCEIIP